MKKLGKKHSSAIETISAYCGCIACPVTCMCSREIDDMAEVSSSVDHAFYSNYLYNANR